MKIIEFFNVAKKYKGKTIFKSFSYEINSGKTYLIIGDNGSGKTTLIKGLLGLISFDEGHVEIAPIKITYMPERVMLPMHITVWDFLINMCMIKQVNNACEKLNEMLIKWNLNRDKRIKELSKGMYQKVLIIQMLIDDCDLYLFDEPLNGLDTLSRTLFLKEINKLKELGRTVIISSHYPDVFSYDKVLVVSDGYIYESLDQMSS